MLGLRAAGQRFVLLNAAVAKADVSLSEAGLPSRWKIGPPTLDYAHASYVTVDVSATLKALRPLRPAHVSVQRNGAGVEIKWIRQTRNGGDAWELEDVPLGEAVERYQLAGDEWCNGCAHMGHAQCRNSFTATQNLATDFGALPNSLTLRVAQFSATVGAGPFLERTLNV